MKTYSGKYKPVNPSKYKGDPESVVYRSKWEFYVMRHLDNNKSVVEWSSEEIVIPYRYDIDGRYHRYFPDFYVKYNNGKSLLIEVKPAKETAPPRTPERKTKRFITESLTWVKNCNKWKSAEDYAKDKGWNFVIWSENDLISMGIMPKSIKPLKKMKPFTKKKTK